MDKQFFLPVGRLVTIVTMQKEFKGFLEGVINFGGIPALWITDTLDGDIIEMVIPLPQIMTLHVIKPGNQFQI